MNLIEAVLKVKDGERVIFTEYYSFLYLIETRKDKIKFLVHIIDELRHTGKISMLLDNNWQIERKPMVWEGECEWIEYYVDNAGHVNGFVIPMEVNEEIKKLFRGKRTKLRIEEIIDREE